MTVPSTDRLDAIRARLAAVGDRPWSTQHNDYGDEWWFGGSSGSGENVLAFGDDDFGVLQGDCRAEAALIADAPADIEFLLTLVDALQGQLDKARESAVLDEIAAERARQEAKWGEQNHPDLDPHDFDTVVRNEYAFRADRWKEINDRRAKDGCEVKYRDPNASCTAWDGVLLEEVYEALAEDDQAKVRAELVQVAAVAVAWVEAIDRRDSSQALGQGGEATDE